MEIKNKTFDWKEYLSKRPDLKKNCNSPPKARIHYFLFARVEEIVYPMLKKLNYKFFNYFNQKTLYIHIGTRRSGSTSIQEFLYQNEKAGILKKRGLRYCSTGIKGINPLFFQQGA